MKIPAYNIEEFNAAHAIKGMFSFDRLSDLTPQQGISYPHEHNFYTIYWITKGSARHVIDYKEVTVNGDALLFLSPHQLHQRDEIGTAEGFRISFTEQFLLANHPNNDECLEFSFLDNPYNPPVWQLDATQHETLVHMLQAIREEMAAEPPSESSVCHLLFVFLNRIQRMIYRQQHIQFDKLQVVIFKKFQKLVDLNYKKQPQIAFYADMLAVSINRLDEITFNIAGKPAQAVLLDHALTEAKRRLVYGDKSQPEQIARELGFKNPDTFTESFKLTEGETPDAFKERIGSWR
jgi:AraC-like DNA-binding protein